MRFDGGLGIKAVTTWIPETCETVEYAVRAGLLNASAVGRQGVTALPVSADLAPPQMAVLAGRKALTRARWDSAKIGMLAHAWVYHQGHDKWSPAHYIANELHLPASALPFGIQAMCTGGATGLTWRRPASSPMKKRPPRWSPPRRSTARQSGIDGRCTPTSDTATAPPPRCCTVGTGPRTIFSCSR